MASIDGEPFDDAQAGQAEGDQRPGGRLEEATPGRTAECLQHGCIDAQQGVGDDQHSQQPHDIGLCRVVQHTAGDGVANAMHRPLINTASSEADSERLPVYRPMDGRQAVAPLLGTDEALQAGFETELGDDRIAR